MKIKLTLIFTNLLISLSFTFGQTGNIFDVIESKKTGQGKVKIIQDESIQQLLENQVLEESKNKGISGYRIRIFSDSGPDAKLEFEETKARFISSFDTPIHERFDYPFYKIYVGDFRTRSEAMKLLVQIERKFPDAFIVESEINFPNLNSNE